MNEHVAKLYESISDNDLFRVTHYYDTRKRDLTLFDPRLDVNMLMAFGAEKGHMRIVNYFIGKGADKWNLGLGFAAKGGHKDLIDFFIEKGANNWNGGLRGAAENGNIELVIFFMKKGANKKKVALDGAAAGGHIDLMKIFINKGAKNINSALIEAVKGYHWHTDKSMEVIKYLLELGADANVGLNAAQQDNNQVLIDYFNNL